MVEVKVHEGILEGLEVDNELGGKYFSFKGIPYAQPPIGDLRFKAPQPPKPWTGVRSAKEHGPQCYQFDIFFNGSPSGSEDCLYLNVYTPTLTPNKPLPVMFWIHGGAFVCGNGNADIYAPDYLIRHGVILVTINYRLEVLGFLSLNSEDIPGNAGMKDQVAALRWVKKNIRNFGGDPENITIFGESAGSASVSYHLISPMTKGLFKRAIAQSGAALNPWAIASEPRDIAKALARKLGLDSDDDKELYEFFKKQPVENLINAGVSTSLSEEANVKKDLQYNIVDEKQFGNNERFFYGNPWDVVRNQGIHEGVQVITGVCKHEGPIFVPMLQNMEKFLKQLAAYPEMFVPREIMLNCSWKDVVEVGRKVRKFYFGDKQVSPDTLDNLFSFLSNAMFIYGTIQLAKMTCSKSKFLAKMTCSKSKLYLYKFTCFTERNKMGDLLKVKDLIKDQPVILHGDDLSYFFPMSNFGHQKVDKDSEAFEIIDRVTKLWTNFAKFGNPTPDSSLDVTWPAYTVEKQEYLDIGNQLATSTKLFDEEIKFFEDIFRQYLPSCVA